MDILDQLENESEDEVEAMTAADVLQKLEEAWMNEKFAPELLEAKTEFVDCMLEQISEMEENIKRAKKGDFKVSLHSMEIDRIRYVITSYLRCRLKKIEQFTSHILEEEQTRKDEDQSKLSTEEFTFAREYAENIQTHLQNMALRHMPQNLQNLNPKQTAPRPNLDKYVFLKVQESTEGVLVEEETLDVGKEISLGEEDIATKTNIVSVLSKCPIYSFFQGVDTRLRLPIDDMMLQAKGEEIVDLEKGDQHVMRYRPILPLVSSGFPMLDTVPHSMAQKMPVDFATYLLSSSPPATNLELLSYAFSESARKSWTQAIERNNQQNGLNESVDEDENSENFSKAEQIPKAARNRLKPIIIRKDDFSSDGESTVNSECASGNVTPTSPCSPKLNKKVSFADHRGYALATIRIMTERSDQPPNLTMDILKSIKKGAKADATGLPPFKLRFVQPASDYMAFRDRIEKNKVSLENVILRDYNVLGTVKVKNVSFEKRVFVRCSFDSWESSQDYEAKYVPSAGCMSQYGMDTFSFEFDIETHCNHVIQFAVCFESSGQQYWDNNSGDNYEIMPTDFSAPHKPHNLSWTTETLLQSSHVHNWSQYGCWNHVDTSSPYY